MLGFSPVKGIAKMVGGDAVILYYTPTERRKFHAVDYYMTAKSQVTCPMNTESYFGARDL